MSARLRLPVSGSKSGWLLNATVPRRIPDLNEQIELLSWGALHVSLHPWDARIFFRLGSAKAKAVCRDIARRGGRRRRIARQILLRVFFYTREIIKLSFHGSTSIYVYVYVYARAYMRRSKRFAETNVRKEQRNGKFHAWNFCASVRYPSIRRDISEFETCDLTCRE